MLGSIYECIHELEDIVSTNKNKIWQHMDKMLGINKATTVNIDKTALNDYYAKVFFDETATLRDEVRAPNRVPSTTPCMYVSVDEVRDAMGRSQRKKACGADGFPAGLVKDLCKSDEFTCTLTMFINLCIKYAWWPDCWNELLITPILKPGKDPALPPSYRPIHIASVIAKIVSIVTEKKVRQAMHKCYVQMGFTEYYGTRDGIFTLFSCIDRYIQQGLFVTFVDFKAAFDSIDRALLIQKLRDMHILDDAWIDFIDVMHRNVRACVNGTSTLFEENVGVKQGDPLGPLLFILYIHDLGKTLSKSADPDMIALSHRIIRCILYADDLALFSRTAKGMQHQLDTLSAYCEQYKLTVNVEKTKGIYIHRGRFHDCMIPVLMYRSECIEMVKRFTYLGVLVNEHGTMDEHIDNVLSKFRRAMYACIDRVLRMSKDSPLHVSTSFSWRMLGQ